MINPNYYRNNNYYNNYSPFNVARMNNNNVFFTPKKNMSLSRSIQGIEKGIDTINSIIPLYQKVTPLISSGKDIFKKVKNTFIKKNETVKEKVDVEIVDTNNKYEDNINIKKEETKPNNPYF